MRQQFLTFLLRWALNSLGIWVAIRLFGTGLSDAEITAGVWAFILAGLIFSLINSLIKPIVIILSLPAILLTLGVFTLVVNGLMVYLALLLAPGLSMTFGHSILAGIVLSLVNYIVTSALQLQYQRQKEGEV